MTLPRWLSRRSVPYAVLAMGLILTVLGTYFVLRTNQARDELRFRAAADEIRHLIEIRLDTYVEVLRAGAALFAASDTVALEEFRTFIEHLDLHERYPGIQGIGYAEPTTIEYLEPLDERNRAALGYDMASEPVRRAAMERARDTGEPAASGRVTLVQEIDERSIQPGFLIYVPVYRNGEVTATVEQRRNALAGYVYSPFRMDDLMRGILDEKGIVPLDFEVYDGADASPGRLLYVTSNRYADARNLLRATHTIDVAGRPWTIVFAGPQPFGGSARWIAPTTLAGGLVVAFALFGITYAQLRAWELAERHAAELRAREEALRQSEARLRRLVVLEREARAEAQAADRAKDEFLATLSHELRTPLNAILGWLSMLRAGTVRDERKADALEVIERNARTQARLIEDLLDVSRIITGKVRLDLHPVPLGPIAETAVQALRPGADAKGLRLRTSIHHGAGAIMGDSARLQQIVWNLLSNAIKFTPPGGEVSLDLARVDDQVELRVRDTGIGIAPEFLPHVFERFRQADSSTTRAHTGVGLGLAIVRHLVELHGGRIWAESEGPDRGSLFVARFPLARPASGPRPDADRQDRVELDGVRILVVDDDADTREMLTEALTHAGAQVVTVGSADEALAALSERGADVLVSDIAMPQVDGYEFMRHVRQLGGAAGRIPAVALTAYARPEDQARVMEAGFQLHMAKPVDIEALLRSLSSLLRPAPRV